MEVQFSLVLPPDATSVPVVRSLARSCFATLGIADECAEELELVISEACTNVLKHAVPADDCYEVRVSTSPTLCDIRVRDTGRGFDGRFDPRTDHPPAEGGRGIHLMRELVDRLQFVSKEGAGTMVHLEKALVLRPDSPLHRRVAHDVAS
jgi:serine/threonine-protein kinase RsbW